MIKIEFEMRLLILVVCVSLLVIFSCNPKKSKVQFTPRLGQAKVFSLGTEFEYSFEFLPKLDSVYITYPVKTIKAEVVKFDLKGVEHLGLNYHYPPQVMNATSTIIENDSAVWMHPPRMFQFKILELNPFPMVHFPLELGRKWQDTLRIGQHYGDPMWVEWEGNITNISKFEIVGDTVLSSPLGDQKCFVIASNAQSKLGSTYLTSYYNASFGFMRLEYQNIDGSELVLLMESHKMRPSRYQYELGF